jgi:hypothetical protein
LQESEISTEKLRARVEITSDELDRLLSQRDGESSRENPIQAKSPSAVTGKRAIGKAVVKGGLLLKGKTVNVRFSTNYGDHGISDIIPDPETRRGHEITVVIGI